MSKDKIADYDGTTAGNNTDIGGISIAEGMLPSAVNNSMRELTKQLGAFANGTDAIDALTSDGNILVGTTDTVPSNNGASGDAGVAISPDGVFRAARSGNVSLDINRMDSDGQIAAFRKDGTTVGSIGSKGGDLTIGTGVIGVRFEDSNNAIVPFDTSTLGSSDNDIDLGKSSVRWNDLYLGGNLYIGGTGSANALSDYEEGEFDIDVVSSNATVNTSQDRCRYTKIGRMVYVSGTIKFSSVTSSTDNIRITGLPFTTASNVSGGEAYGHLSVMLNNVDGGNAGSQFLLSFSTTGGDLYALPESGSLNTVRTSALASSSEIYFQGWYITA